MLCSNCKNILEKVSDSSGLKFRCTSCGSDFPANSKDSLFIDDEKKIYSLAKSGKSIWYYPSNPKVLKPCPECKAKIVAYERDKEMNNRYGCQCGHTWFELLSS